MPSTDPPPSSALPFLPCEAPPACTGTGTVADGTNKAPHGVHRGGRPPPQPPPRAPSQQGSRDAKPNTPTSGAPHQPPSLQAPTRPRGRPWLIATANVTAFRSAHPLLERHDADVICLQETKLLPDAILGAEVWAAGRGWKLVASPCLTGKAGKPRAGTAVAVRSYVGVGFWPGTTQAEIWPGRAVGCHVGGLAKGGIAVASIYLQPGLGLRGTNSDVLDRMAAWLRRCRGPWILAGDWNNPPTDLGPWAASVGGVVCRPPSPIDVAHPLTSPCVCVCVGVLL